LLLQQVATIKAAIASDETTSFAVVETFLVMFIFSVDRRCEGVRVREDERRESVENLHNGFGTVEYYMDTISGTIA
jgi:hypothetical protein